MFPIETPIQAQISYFRQGKIISQSIAQLPINYSIHSQIINQYSTDHHHSIVTTIIISLLSLGTNETGGTEKGGS